ncbi:hypothetical protein [Vreelandella sp. EE27]
MTKKLQKFLPSDTESCYTPTAFRLDSIPYQKAMFATGEINERKFVQRLAWSNYVGVNPTAYQYSETSPRFFSEPKQHGECEMDESKWYIKLDENFNDFDVVKSYFKSIYDDCFCFWDSTTSHGKFFYMVFAICVYIAYKVDSFSVIAVLLSPIGWMISIFLTCYVVIKWFDNDNKYHRLSLSGLNDCYLSRKTGMVFVPWGEFHFYEFDAYIVRKKNIMGDERFVLNLIHRYPIESYSPSVYQSSSFLMDIEGGIKEYQALWDMMCRYMDISQPLPDIPQLEPFRAHDLTTRLYDEEASRSLPDSYWVHFYNHVTWQGLEKARIAHQSLINKLEWKGQANLMK